MKPSLKSLHTFLELQYQIFNQENAISEEYLDPLLVAREFIILVLLMTWDIIHHKDSSL